MCLPQPGPDGEARNPADNCKVKARSPQQHLLLNSSADQAARFGANFGLFAWNNRNNINAMRLGTRRSTLVTAIGALAVGGICLLWATGGVGQKVDSYRGVAVYDNGPLVAKSHGRHYSKEGYYFGQKWQCVEFMKRFLYEALGHRMPDVWGNAKDFFDDSLPTGALNPKRGLLQYRNGGPTSPLPGDVLVFTNGAYGHVAIVCLVGTNQIEVIQQNIDGHPRARFTLSNTDGRFLVGEKYQPAGWLRVPAAH